MREDNWWIKDVAKEMQGTPSLSVMSYFEELEEVEEVCMLHLGDIHIDTQVENAILIKNLPCAYSLLESLEDRMTSEEKSDFERIRYEFKNRVLNLLEAREDPE